MLRRWRRNWRRRGKGSQHQFEAKSRDESQFEQSKPILNNHHFQNWQYSKVYVNTKCIEQYGSSCLCDCENCAVIRSLFECPVCNNTVSGTFYCCLLNEHLVCGSCKGKIDCCPICRDPTLRRVDRGALKRIRDEVLLPCSFKDYGCKVQVRGEHLPKHEKTCPYRPVKCPLDSFCKWEGSWDDCLRHVTTAHKCDTYDGAVFNFVVPNAKQLFLRGIAKKFSIIRAFNNYFLLQFHSMEYCIVLSLTLIRSESVSNSDYNVYIRWNEEWSFSSRVPDYNPTSMSDPFQHACLVLTVAQLPEEDLIINMEIKRVSKRRSIS